jgi:hypothetical protein
MRGFKSTLWVTPRADGRCWTVGWNDFVYEDPDGRTIVVQPGFTTDFASIPQILWNKFPPWQEYGWASVIHDKCYQAQEINGVPIRKDEADLIFLHAMEDHGVEEATRLIIYEAVKVGGFAAWNGHTDELRAKQNQPTNEKTTTPFNSHDVIWHGMREPASPENHA